jgi:hypothetical protein
VEPVKKVQMGHVDGVIDRDTYAGFAFDIGCALIAHFAVGDGPEAWGWAAGTGVLWGSRTSSGGAYSEDEHEKVGH